MTKKLLYLTALFLLSFSSCTTKRNLIVTLPQQRISLDTALQAPLVGLPESMQNLLVFDQSSLKKLNHRPAVVRRPAASKEDEIPVAKVPVVRGGTRITVSIEDVSSQYTGVDRIKKYDFTHRDVPQAFDGCRLAFISDVHYKSLFKEKGLKDLVTLLIRQNVDALLIGGDMHEGCQYVAPLMKALSKVKTPLGSYAVLGNNDYEACYEDVVREMERNHITVLEHKVATLHRGGANIKIAGVRNPFDLEHNGQSPTLRLSPNDFVILLTHTPDYAEDVAITNTDLVLAGHTHGGQVTLFGYAPIVPSRYGQRFLTGLKYNSSHIPMIITNGIGTSKQPIRLGAPAEIVLITLHRLKN